MGWFLNIITKPTIFKVIEYCLNKIPKGFGVKYIRHILHLKAKKEYCDW